jgi:hypothetical protein
MKKDSLKFSPKIRYLSRVGIVVAVCLLAAVLLAKPVYRVFRNWRVESNAAEAGEALAAGKFPEARRLAMSVLRLQENRHDMLKVLHCSMAALNDPGAADVSRMLMAHPDATEEDRVRGFQECCAELPIATVAGIWMAMGKEKAESSPYLTPFTRRLIDQDLLDAAAELLLNRRDLDREPELRLQAVRVMMKHGSAKLLERAQYEISEMMQDDGKLSMPAYRLLAAVPPEALRSAYFPELEKWVKQQDGATVDDQLFAVSQRLQRFPKQKESIAQQVIDAHAEANTAAVARWLIRVGMAEKALELLSAEHSLTDEDCFRTRARALISLQRWQEARDWLAKAPDSFPLVELHAMQVVCDDTPGDPIKHGKAWNLAMRIAGSKADPNDYLELHDRMREAGLDELAREAMVEAVRTGRGRLPSWEQVRELLPWLRDRQDGRAMLDLCSAMSKLDPYNEEVAIESLDLACIFGRIVPSDLVARLEGVQKRAPEIAKLPRFKELRATALLADGQAQEALAALGGAQNQTGASHRMIAVAAFANVMLGENTASSQLLARVDWKQMIREEREFFTSLQKDLLAPGSTEAIGSQFDPKIRQPSDEPLEMPFARNALPPITGELEKNTESKDLPTISDGTEAKFKTKDFQVSEGNLKE